jgi:hypothetical protein
MHSKNIIATPLRIEQQLLLIKRGCLSILFLLTFYSCKRLRLTNTGFNRVTIHYVNKNITTFALINCDEFESRFNAIHKEIKITDSVFIQQLRRCLLNEKHGFKTNIDVRTKVYLYKDEKLLAIYCIDRNDDLILNGIENVKNTCFTDLINKKIE